MGRSNNKAAIRMRLADVELSRLVVRLVVTEPGERRCELVNRRSGNVIDHMTYEAAQKLQNVTYRWRVWLAVYMRNRMGQEFIQTEIVQPDRPCKQSELVDILEAEHKRFIASQNSEFVISAGWVASHTGGDFKATELLDVPAIWLNPAKWECT